MNIHRFQMNKSKGLKCRIKRCMLRIRRFYGVSGKTVEKSALLLAIIGLIFVTIILKYRYSGLDSLYRLAKAFSTTNNVVVQKRNNVIAENCIVQSPLCSIPDIHPYHDSVKNFLFQWAPISCSTLKPLTSVVYDSVSQRHTVKIDFQAISNYSSPLSEFHCCYSVITREYYAKMRALDDDNRYTMGGEICFANETQLPAGTEYIYATCKSNSKNVYQTVHFMVANKKPKISPVIPDSAAERKKISILLLGINSMSRLNFFRTFPKTQEYIQKRGWVPLLGYTKVADSTFSNFIALLTGMSVQQLIKTCVPSWMDKLDNCPFIWQNLSKSGYLTSFSEDAVEMGAFNLAKYGFLNSPTDYYSRPIMEVAHKMLPWKHKYGDTSYCLGDRPQVEYLLDFNTEFLQRYHDRPYFNMFWSSSFSHHDLNMPSIMDDRYKHFLQDIENYLNSTVVFFYSDHGSRWGKFRETYSGWHEERMPFIYIYLPPAIKATHPRWYRNLSGNKNKLVSTFDLHATLQELLYGKVLPPPGGRKCSSVLRGIRRNRDCAHASISPHWCTCSGPNSSKSVVNEPYVTEMAKLAIDSINKFLQKNTGHVNRGYHCSNLSFNRIIGARRKFTNGDSSVESENTFVIVFETQPNGAIYEFTRMRFAKNAIRVKEISRLNRYNKQSACVKVDYVLKLFCFCEDIKSPRVSKKVERQKPTIGKSKEKDNVAIVETGKKLVP